MKEYNKEKTLHLDKNGIGEISLNNKEKLKIMFPMYLKSKYFWSWKKFKFDWWVQYTGAFWNKNGTGSIRKMQTYLKKHFNVVVR